MGLSDAHRERRVERTVERRFPAGRPAHGGDHALRPGVGDPFGIEERQVERRGESGPERPFDDRIPFGEPHAVRLELLYALNALRPRRTADVVIDVYPVAAVDADRSVERPDVREDFGLGASSVAQPYHPFHGRIVGVTDDFATDFQPAFRIGVTAHFADASAVQPAGRYFLFPRAQQFVRRTSAVPEAERKSVFAGEPFGRPCLASAVRRRGPVFRPAFAFGFERQGQRTADRDEPSCFSFHIRFEFGFYRNIVFVHVHDIRSGTRRKIRRPHFSADASGPLHQKRPMRKAGLPCPRRRLSLTKVGKFSRIP